MDILFFLLCIPIIAAVSILIHDRVRETAFDVFEDQDESFGLTIPPKYPMPMQVIESEGPFDNAIELLNIIGAHKVFDDWGIYVDGKLLRTAIPAEGNKYLVYETIGNRIYRK